MPVPTYRPTGTKPWGLLGYLKDFISPPGYVARGPFGARAASAAEGAAPTDAELMRQGYGFGVHEYNAEPRANRPAAPTDAELMRQGYGFGVHEYDAEVGGRRRTPGATTKPTPIVLGTRDGVTPDRTQSDTYKQYALNPQGQFQRYFGTGEMDPYFGATSRGAGAPKDVAAMQALAAQTKAPLGTPLSSYYRAESAVGRAEMPEVIKDLGYAKDSNLARWAAANPMLAQRLRVKQGKPGAELPGFQSTPEQLQAAQGGYPAGTQPLGADTSFSIAANNVPAPWNQQGAMVDLNRGAPALFSKQAEFTSGENMPQFQTTLEKAEDFLKNRAIKPV